MNPIEAIKKQKEYEGSLHQLVLDFDDKGKIKKAKKEFIEALEKLRLDASFDINKKIENWTALQLAVGIKKDYRLLKILSKYHPSYTDKVGNWGLLQMICRNGDKIFVDPNDNKKKRKGYFNLEMLDFFLTILPVDGDPLDPFQPIHIAAYYNFPEIALKLCQKWSKHYIKNGYAPIHFTCFPQSNGNPAALNVLIGQKVDLNVRSSEGLTPLMLACRHGLLEHVKALLETKKINMNLEDRNKKKALDYAQGYEATTLTEISNKGAIIQLLTNDIVSIAESILSVSNNSPKKRLSPQQAANTLIDFMGNSKSPQTIANVK